MYWCYRIIVVSAMAMVMLAVPVGAEVVSRDHLSNQANSYLELLDQDRCEEAWHTMSALFQMTNDQTQWQNRQRAVRAAYGAVASRQVYRISYRQSYNLSPDGQYVTVQFKSAYQNKANAVETVVFDCRTLPECSIRQYIIN